VRSVVQRVTRASVSVGGVVTGAIRRGLLVLVGVAAMTPKARHETRVLNP
jgi:D-Tyr-tRNAtyr deacylase